MNRRSLSRLHAAGTALLISLALASCGGGSDSGLPYDIDTTVIIYPDGTVAEVPTPNGSDCIDLGSECASPQTVCGSDQARADLVVDGAGNVIEIVCYPIEDDGSIIQIDETSVIATDPGDVVVIDDVADGPDIIGDVNLAGDNTVVFGFSPGTAVIDGNVTLSGGQTIARGVLITGNLYMTGGNASAVFVEVLGDVIANGNGALLASSVVHGTVDYSGSGLELVGNALQGGLSASAGLAACSDNVEFVDGDMDLRLDRPGEITGDFVCP